MSVWVWVCFLILQYNNDNIEYCAMETNLCSIQVGESVTNWRRHVPWFPFFIFLLSLLLGNTVRDRAQSYSCQNCWRFASRPAWIRSVFAVPNASIPLRYSGLFCLMCFFVYICLCGFCISFTLSPILCCLFVNNSPSPASLSVAQHYSTKLFNHFTILSLFLAAEVAPVCHLCECVCLKLYLSFCLFR